MGQRLTELFTQAEALAGIHGRVRLAQLSRMTSTQAEQAADSPENLRRVAEALAQLRQQTAHPPAHPPSHPTPHPPLHSTSSAPVPTRPPEPRHVDALRTAESRPGSGEVRLPEASPSSELRLRRHLQLAAELLGHRALFLGDVGKTVSHVTETASLALLVERVSVWFYDEGRTLIRCADLYQRQTAKHSAGTELLARDYPPYFTALKTERTIAARDAHTDPRTAVFSASYLTPLGINSMLDVPIWTQGRMVGVICHEHTGPRRTWTADEETFAFLLSNLVALALELRDRPAHEPGPPRSRIPT